MVNLPRAWTAALALAGLGDTESQWAPLEVMKGAGLQFRSVACAGEGVRGHTLAITSAALEDPEVGPVLSDDLRICCQAKACVHVPDVSFALLERGSHSQMTFATPRVAVKCQRCFKLLSQSCGHSCELCAGRRRLPASSASAPEGYTSARSRPYFRETRRLCSYARSRKSAVVDFVFARFCSFLFSQDRCAVSGWPKCWSTHKVF